MSRAAAQELEPGAYWPLPVGLNIVTGVDSFSWGSVTFDPALPVTDADATINTTAIVYTRALSIAGRSANIGIQLPIVAGHVEGTYLGTFTEVDRFGQADPRFRLAINLYGAAAMAPKAFASYRLKTILGVSVAVAPPLGQYDDTKVINLGTNRWAIKSEMGFAHFFRRWVVELMGGVVLLHRQLELPWRKDTRAGPDRVSSGSPHIFVSPQRVARRRRKLLPGRHDEYRRAAES